MLYFPWQQIAKRILLAQEYPLSLVPNNKYYFLNKNLNWVDSCMFIPFIMIIGSWQLCMPTCLGLRKSIVSYNFVIFCWDTSKLTIKRVYIHVEHSSSIYIPFKYLKLIAICVSVLVLSYLKTNSTHE